MKTRNIFTKTAAVAALMRAPAAARAGFTSIYTLGIVTAYNRPQPASEEERE